MHRAVIQATLLFVFFSTVLYFFRAPISGATVSAGIRKQYPAKLEHAFHNEQLRHGNAVPLTPAVTLTLNYNGLKSPRIY